MGIEKPSDSFAIQISKEIGQISGELRSLVATVNTMAIAINHMDDRLRKSESDAARMAARIGLLGIIAGGVGTFIMDLLIKKI